MLDCFDVLKSIRDLVFDEVVKVFVGTVGHSDSDVAGLNLRKGIVVAVQVKVSQDVQLLIVSYVLNGFFEHFPVY